MKYQKRINRIEILDFDKVYHIYNKAVGNENLFNSDNDYFFFLKKFNRYILPLVNVYAYCLLPNHFHFLLRIKDNKKNISSKSNLTGSRQPVRLVNSQEPKKQQDFEMITELKQIHQAFSNFFNSYTKSFNKIYGRSGKLFNLPFKRVLVDKEIYFTILINYIHRNPIHHKFTDEYSSWKYSSYNSYLSKKPTNVRREEIIERFGTTQDFIIFHKENISYSKAERYLLE